MENKMKCSNLKSQMADLLLDDSFRSTEAGLRAKAHVAECGGCAAELAALQATMDMMDAWGEVEPSPYFDTRMQSRLRQELAAPQASAWQRIVDRIAGMGSSALKPAMAGVMAVAIVIGGATYVGSSFFDQPHVPMRGAGALQESAALSDLQSLDHNAQTIDDLNSLDQQLNADDNSSSGTAE